MDGSREEAKVAFLQPSPDSGFEDAVPQYSYEHLHGDSGWIRVLQLRTTSAQIECYVKQIKCTDGGYQALSYVWGSKDVIHKAYVVDPRTGKFIGHIPLTTNLYNALCDLRDSQDVVDKVFWIDQICINQSAVEEKNHQVAMMGKIYSNASRVITYIGPSDTDRRLEQKSIELLERLYQHFSPNYTYFAQNALIEIWKDTSVLPVTKLPADLAAEDPEDFWGWKWLVEVVDGTRAAAKCKYRHSPGTAYSGLGAVALIATLFWVYLLPSQAFYRVWEAKRDPSLESDLASPWDFPFALTDFWKTRRKFTELEARTQTTQHTRTLIENMYSFDALRCQDPRDRVYALLAISSDSAEIKVIPDYTVPKDMVFSDVSVRIFSTVDQLKALSYVCWWNNDSEPDRPSWAINTPRPPLEMAYWTTDMNTIRTHPRLTTKINFSPDNRIMLLRGRKVDSIKFGSRPNYTNGSVDLEIRDFRSATFYLNLLASWSEVLLDAPEVDLETISALYRCTLPNPVWNPKPRNGHSHAQERIYHLLCIYRVLYKVEVIPHLHDFRGDSAIQAIKDVTSIIKQLEDLYTRCGRSSTYLSNHVSTKQEDDDGLAFYNSILKVGRSFGKTTCGRTFSSMHGVEEGDAVVALEGSGDKLWKLRPVGNNKYRLVGDIYVDGYMQGELYEGIDPDEVDYEINII